MAYFNRVPWWRYFTFFKKVLDPLHTGIRTLLLLRYALGKVQVLNKCSHINNNKSFIPFAYGHPWHSRKMENVGVHQPLYHVTGLSSPCYHAAMLQCCHATMLPCYHAAILPCYHATMLSCCHATMLPCYHATMLPCYHATMLPCYHVTMLPCYHDTMIPCYHDTMLP
jgi:hypothetical protein